MKHGGSKPSFVLSLPEGITLVTLCIYVYIHIIHIYLHYLCVDQSILTHYYHLLSIHV